MASKFILIYNLAKDKEILLNVDAITEIHVEYVEKDKHGQRFATGLEAARNDPNAIKIYHVYAPSGIHRIETTVGTPVGQILDNIYKGAIRNN